MVGGVVGRVARRDDVPPTARTPAIELVGVSVLGRPPISLAVAPGEVIGVAGLVGSGRSRLARALVGVGRHEGRLRVAGREVAPKSPADAARSGVVMLPEDRRRDGLVMPASIGANVALTALDLFLTRLGFVRRSARARLVRDLMERLGIVPNDPERTVRTLSGGNQQKVLMARAFAAAPRVLVLDQPTAGVDVGAKAEIYERIKVITAEGVAVIVISDDLDELLLLADRILILHGGRPVGLLPATSLPRDRLLAAATTGTLEGAA
jgi:ABC-type sugar transport system ATPase subunit